jgi:hypothetical protein
MKIEFSKEVVQDMMAMFGKERAVDELTSACRAAIESGVADIEKELTEKNG